MLQLLGAFLSRRARAVLALAGIVVIVMAAAAPAAVSTLKRGGFEDPGAPSTRAAQLLDQEFGGTTDLVLLVRPDRGTVDSRAARAAGRSLTERVSEREGVESVLSYWQQRNPALRAEDGRAGLLLIRLAGNEQQVTERAEELIDDYADGDAAGRDLTVLAGGPAGTSHDVVTRLAGDLGVAEAVAVPVTLVLLVFIFRGLIPALVPLAIGLVAILGTFAELYVLGSVTEVSTFATNLTTALGLGLAVDYGLLMVSRFREQVAAGYEVQEAVVRTVAGAGRTILFSAATFTAALTALLIFPLYLLRSFAYAGIGVVAIAALAALVLAPALLTVLGHRVAAQPRTRGRHRAARPADQALPTLAGRRIARSRRIPGRHRAEHPAASEPGPQDAGVPALWGRIAVAVLRRPLHAALPAVAVLLAAAAPLLGAEFGIPDERVLPEESASRTVATAVREDFPGGGIADPVEIVTNGPALTSSQIVAYAGTLAALPGVDAVETSAGTVQALSRRAKGPADPSRTVAGQQHLTVRTHTALGTSAEEQRLVRQIRETAPPHGTEALVGGPAARLTDTKHVIGERLPLALLMIGTTTFALLFCFTGSVVQPLRALALNLLGLGAVTGAMVWIFQEGHLSSLLGFTPTPMDTAMTLLMLCIVFGLSMDYEVFVLSRIKELHDQGLPTARAVPTGLARTGAIVSAAAALLTVSLLAPVFGSVSFMQMFGLGSGLAVLVDATVIRGVLVPACFGLLGENAWYAPRWLRRVHARIGLAEAPAERGAGFVPLRHPRRRQSTADTPPHTGGSGSADCSRSSADCLSPSERCKLARAFPMLCQWHRKRINA
ncbi:MMPL family transporter [Streptomyces sp. NPDC086554]|uniref:MMPL family transporter n=1 Tax=Streptomyces sp. NPDC086554 TaxID=3154864 RepID=UPI00344686E1